jgi:phage-related protein
LAVADTSREKVRRFACRFYRTDAGSEPVRDWLKSLPTEVRKDIGPSAGSVAMAPREAPCRRLRRGLFEIRTSFGGDIYRVRFCLDGSTMVLLHGFKKKSQRTPMSDLDPARKRQRKLEED